MCSDFGNIIPKLRINIFDTMRKNVSFHFINVVVFCVVVFFFFLFFFFFFFLLFYLGQITYNVSMSLHDNFHEHFGPRSKSNFVESDMVQNFGKDKKSII